MIVKSSERLMALQGQTLEIFHNMHGVCVRYKNAEVKDGVVLAGVYGVGDDFEKACDDYLLQISGKTLVFNAYSDKRKEVFVL